MRKRFGETHPSFNWSLTQGIEQLSEVSLRHPVYVDAAGDGEGWMRSENAAPLWTRVTFTHSVTGGTFFLPISLQNSFAQKNFNCADICYLKSRLPIYIYIYIYKEFLIGYIAVSLLCVSVFSPFIVCPCFFCLWDWEKRESMFVNASKISENPNSDQPEDCKRESKPFIYTSCMSKKSCPILYCNLPYEWCKAS